MRTWAALTAASSNESTSGQGEARLLRSCPFVSRYTSRESLKQSNSNWQPWIGAASTASVVPFLTGQRHFEVLVRRFGISMFISSGGNRVVEGSWQLCAVSLLISQDCPAAVLPKPSVLRSYMLGSAKPRAGLGLSLVCRAFSYQCRLTSENFKYNQLASWSRGANS
jgi:hypothetical protein